VIQRSTKLGAGPYIKRVAMVCPRGTGNCALAAAAQVEAPCSTVRRA